jgi:hypothetical protein
MQLPRRGLPLVPIAVALAILAYFLFWPVPIDPVVWQPAANPGMSGPYAPNKRLSGMRRLPDVGPGPESVAIDRDGDVAQALAPAVSRLISTLFVGVTRCRTKSVPMSGDAAGMSACATSYPRTPVRNAA